MVGSADFVSNSAAKNGGEKEKSGTGVPDVVRPVIEIITNMSPICLNVEYEIPCSTFDNILYTYTRITWPAHDGG